MRKLFVVFCLFLISCSKSKDIQPNDPVLMPYTLAIKVAQDTTTQYQIQKYQTGKWNYFLSFPDTSLTGDYSIDLQLHIGEIVRVIGIQQRDTTPSIEMYAQ